MSKMKRAISIVRKIWAKEFPNGAFGYKTVDELIDEHFTGRFTEKSKAKEFTKMICLMRRLRKFERWAMSQPGGEMRYAQVANNTLNMEGHYIVRKIPYYDAMDVQAYLGWKWHFCYWCDAEGNEIKYNKNILAAVEKHGAELVIGTPLPA